MRTNKLKVNSEKEFSDLDFLLLNYSLASYVIVRFVIESGWLLGTAFSLLIYLALKRLARARHTIYLYVILLFTTENEQKWLLRKFSLNSKIFSSLKQYKQIDEGQVNDVFNKIIEVSWPFVKSYIEEKIRKKVSFLYQKLKNSKLKPLIQYLADLKDEEINLGLQAPIIESVDVIPSRKLDVMVINIKFRYLGNGVLKFFTLLKNIYIKNVKVKGCLRVEVGPLLSTPPFIQGVKIYLTEEPFLDFSIQDFPAKLEKLAKIMSLERISEKLVMPNQIHVSLHQDTYINCFPSGVIFLHVVEGVNLPNKEIFSDSDPFCVVRLGSKKVVSKTMKKTLNPVWKFKSQMICYCDPRQGDFDIHFDVYDKDILMDDILLRSKISVRRILEEKTVDEWLYNIAEEMETKDTKGSIRVQAIWQELSPSAIYPKSEERANEKKSEIADSSDAELSQYSNLTQMNSLNSCENFNRKEVEVSKSLSDGSFEFYKAVLLVWVQTAHKLEPSWDDFQVKLKFYESVEKTSFVPRDLKSKWSFRQMFFFPIFGHEEDGITIKVISRSKNKCEGHAYLKMSKLIEEISKDDNNLSEVFLHKENDKEKDEEEEAFVKLAFLIRGIEPVSSENLALIKRAEIDAESVTQKSHNVTTYSDPSKNNDEVCEEGKKKKATKSQPFFSFPETNPNICPPYVESKLSSENEENERSQKQTGTKLPSGNDEDEGEESKTNTTTDSVVEGQKEVPSKDEESSLKRKDSKRGSRWNNMWKYGRKIKKNPKTN